MHILFLSGHIYYSKNKAGFHHLAHAAQELGHTPYFCTCPNSLLSLAKDIKKKQFLSRLKITWASIKPQKTGSVYCSSYTSLCHDYSHSRFFSALKLRLFSWGFSRLFSKKNTYDTIIFESNVCITLLHRLKKKFPHARLIYRVSDDLAALRASPRLQKIEHETRPYFHLISTPNDAITKRIQHKHPHLSCIITQPHGVNKQLLERAKHAPSPFKKETSIFHAVYTGMAACDTVFLRLASSLRPDIIFHIVGYSAQKIKHKNIIYHGVKPYAESLAFIVHADIALHIPVYPKKTNQTRSAHMKDLSQTLKFMQYLYYGTPIIAPKSMGITEPNVQNYTATETSISHVLDKALTSKKMPITTALDWKDILSDMLT